MANDPDLQRTYDGGLPTRLKAFELPQTSQVHMKNKRKEPTGCPAVVLIHKS